MIANRIAGALALALVLGAAQVARAQEEWEESGDGGARSSWSFGSPRARGVYAAMGGFLAAPNPDGLGRVEGGAGFTTRVGMRGSPNFGGEIVLDWVEGFNRPDGAELETLFLGPNLRGFLPARYLVPYLQGGVGFYHASTGKSAEDAAAGRLGLGVEIPITRHFGLDLEAIFLWAWGDTDGADYAQFSASLQYWF